MKKIAGWKSEPTMIFIPRRTSSPRRPTSRSCPPGRALGRSQRPVRPAGAEPGRVPVPDHPGRRRRHPQAQAHPPGQRHGRGGLGLRRGDPDRCGGAAGQERGTSDASERARYGLFAVLIPGTSYDIVRMYVYSGKAQASTNQNYTYCEPWVENTETGSFGITTTLSARPRRPGRRSGWPCASSRATPPRTTAEDSTPAWTRLETKNTNADYVSDVSIPAYGRGAIFAYNYTPHMTAYAFSAESGVIPVYEGNHALYEKQGLQADHQHHPDLYAVQRDDPGGQRADQLQRGGLRAPALTRRVPLRKVAPSRPPLWKTRRAGRWSSPATAATTTPSRSSACPPPPGGGRQAVAAENRQSEDGVEVGIWTGHVSSQEPLGRC